VEPAHHHDPAALGQGLGGVLGLVAPHDHGEERGLLAALAAWPVAVIGEVARSGLRGRGGAGFPTGDKWRAVRAVGAGPRYAVCNAAEGKSATFKDRLLLRTNPYQVLEGLAIAAYAVGAERAYIGLKEPSLPRSGP
jgi:formate dehydrogenase iron-sulfur subunit